MWSRAPCPPDLRLSSAYYHFRARMQIAQASIMNMALIQPALFFFQTSVPSTRLLATNKHTCSPACLVLERLCRPDFPSRVAPSITPIASFLANRGGFMVRASHARCARYGGHSCPTCTLSDAQLGCVDVFAGLVDRARESHIRTHYVMMSGFADSNIETNSRRRRKNKGADAGSAHGPLAYPTGDRRRARRQDWGGKRGGERALIDSPLGWRVCVCFLLCCSFFLLLSFSPYPLPTSFLCFAPCSLPLASPFRDQACLPASYLPFVPPYRRPPSVPLPPWPAVV